LLAYPFAAALLSEWVDADRLEAARTARHFLGAVKAKDAAHVKRLLAEDATIDLPEMLYMFLHFNFMDPVAGSATIVDDVAQVRFTLTKSTQAQPAIQFPTPKGNEGQLMFGVLKSLADQLEGVQGIVHQKRAGKTWRVIGVTTPALGNLGQKLDFTSRKKALAAVVPKEQKAFDDFTPVSAAAFAASWPRDFAFKDRPAEDVLQRLATDGGLVLSKAHVPIGAPRPLDAAVTIDLQKRARLEAIEEVCKQLNYHPKYEPGYFRVHAKPRPWPAAFAGPFLVAVDDLDEFPSTATATLHLSWLAADLPPAVALLNRTDDRALEIGQITAADGRDLYRAGAQVFFPAARPLAGLPDQRKLVGGVRSIPLKNLFRGMDTIPLVQGKLRVLVPNEVQTFRFDQPTPGASVKRGKAALTCQGVRAAAMPNRHILQFQCDGLAQAPLVWIAVDAAGTTTQGGDIPGSRIRAFEIEVLQSAAVYIKAATTVEEIFYDFTLRDIPLKQRAPPRLDPLRIQGNSPVSAQVSSLQRPKAGVQVASVVVIDVLNHTQKDIDNFEFVFVYRDAAGALLKENVVRHAKLAFNAKRLDVLVAAHARTSLVVPDLDMPEGATACSATARRLGFADGGNWPE
ncbi:MAG: hypothetical protein L0215_21440, partial [Gemmataceae bacterium]|nr:hypothetical protein [Gemmataceae bacterium]